MTHCTPTQSTRLKALGFDKPTRDYYLDLRNKEICKTRESNNWNDKGYNWIKATSAPTPSEVLDWFREEKGIHGWVRVQFDSRLLEMQVLSISYVGYYTRGLELFGRTDNYPTHSEATSALIDKLIEILEQKA